MASQQILFAETIAGMKKAFKRKSYESDSDSEIESYSNRGNKLKKKARFVRQGQLVPNNGPSSYKEVRSMDKPLLLKSNLVSMSNTPEFVAQSFIAIRL
jgi:hypothetical protein